MPATLNVALIGQRFMGRAHSNAWSQANKFFHLPKRVVLHGVAARDALELEPFAARFGWQTWSTDWSALVRGRCAPMNWKAQRGAGPRMGSQANVTDAVFGHVCFVGV